MTILERLNMPACDKIRVPVKTLIEQTEADTKVRKLLETHIAAMYLVSLLNEQTIRIRAYKDEDYSFQTIYVFQIDLKTDTQLTDFTKVIHSAFPESTLLIINYKDGTYLSGAGKRINKLDKTKTVVENSVWIRFERDMYIEPINGVRNLKEYYHALMEELYRLKIQNITGIYPAMGGDYRNFIKQYELIAAQVNKLKDDYSSASMRNEKLRIDEELYVKERELEKLKETISGEK